MEHPSIVGTILLLIVSLVSYKGLRDHRFFDQYKFHVDGILMSKEYYRILSSGFLHANWIHYGFNMIALLSFSFSIEQYMGYPKLALIYFLSLIGGSLLSLYIHRNHGDYSAIGASGAISGVVLSSIVLFPDSNITFILFPMEIPSWIFGIAFMLISIFGIKSQGDNIGHEAHLGGAIIGILSTLALAPQVALENWWIVLLLLVPTTSFLLLIVRNPAVLMISGYWGEGFRAFKDKVAGEPAPTYQKSRTEEINELLDKIRDKGYDSLTKKEQKRLNELRNEL